MKYGYFVGWQGLDVTNRNIFLLLSCVFISMDIIFQTPVPCIIVIYLVVMVAYESGGVRAHSRWG